MKLAFSFAPQSLSPAEYDDIISRLDEAGQGRPSGRLYHVAFSGANGLEVLDIWESEEAFNEFAKTLLPIMTELGIDPGRPAVGHVHNIIEG